MVRGSLAVTASTLLFAVVLDCLPVSADVCNCFTCSDDNTCTDCQFCGIRSAQPDCTVGTTSGDCYTNYTKGCACGQPVDPPSPPVDHCHGKTCSDHGNCTSIPSKCNPTCECFHCDGTQCPDCDHCGLTTDDCNGTGTLPGCYTTNDKSCSCGSKVDCTGYKCTCAPGYNGTDCQVVDHCFQKTCSKHGQCINNASGYECNCQKGYTGQDCEHDPCFQKTCSDHGACKINGGAPSGYSCTCNPGYKGENCADIDYCYGRNCSHHGTCKPVLESLHHDQYSLEDFGPAPSNVTNHTFCTCDLGYTGNDCEFDPCFNHPCGKHGTCEPNLECDCFECSNNCGCQNECDKCGSIVSDPSICDNPPWGCYTTNPGGCACRERRPLTIAFTCTCNGGFIGADCQTVDHCYHNDCPEHSTCKNGPGKKSCTCNHGFTGKDCEDVDYCHQAECPKRSVCVNGPSDYSCKCDDDWTGQSCNTCKAETQDPPDCNGITPDDCTNLPKTIPAKCPFTCNSCILDRCEKIDPKKCGHSPPYSEGNCLENNLVGEDVREECPALCRICTDHGELPAYAYGAIGGGSLLLMSGIFIVRLCTRKRAVDKEMVSFNVNTESNYEISEDATQLLSDEHEPAGVYE